jgi:hypothetical protein
MQYRISFFDFKDAKWKLLGTVSAASGRQALFTILRDLEIRRNHRINLLGGLCEIRRPKPGVQIYEYYNYSFCIMKGD